MGISSAARERKKGQAGRPFTVEKREPRRGDLTSSSAAKETKKQEEAGGPSPIVKQQLQHSEKHAAQVKRVVSCRVSHSEKEHPAPLANNNNCPAARFLPCDLLKNKEEQGEAAAHQIMGPEHHSGDVIEDLKPCKRTENKRVSYGPSAVQGVRLFSAKRIQEEQMPERVYGFERLEQLLEPNRVPVYLLTGSRIVNQILGRDPANQFTQAAFESEGLDPHPSAKAFQRTGCPTFPDTSVPFDKDEYLFERTFTLGELLEGMEDIHQLIVRKREINPKANVNFLWRLIDAKVEICKQIKKEIAAARGSSQEIPHYMIR